MEVSWYAHVTNSVIVVAILNYLRTTQRYQRFANWVPMANGKVHVMMSGIGAAMTALGMHGAAEGSAGTGFKIVLLIPPLWVVAHAAWDVVQQMAGNQLVYWLALKAKQVEPMVTTPVHRGEAPVTVTKPLEQNP
jgi:hypothetical protein